jgi:hypothetical protein
MPDRWTFKIQPIADLLARYVADNWADPFAGETSPAFYTNDIRPNAPVKYHLEATDFVRQLPGELNVEKFRKEIEAQILRLIRDSAGFRLASDFKLISLTNNKVIFHFEKKAGEDERRDDHADTALPTASHLQS